MRNAAWFLLLWVVAGCANSCGCGHDQIEGSAFPGAADAPKTSSGVRSQEQAAAQPAQTANTADTQEGAPPVRAQKLNAPIVPWEELKPLAPDSFEGFTAIAEPTGRTMDLPTGGQLSSLTRRYSKGEDKLEIEVLDSAHSPGVRELFERAARMDRHNEINVVRPVMVQQKYRGLAQWNKGSTMARIGVLVANRLIINFNLRPTASPEAVIALAEKADLARLEKLADTHK